MYMDFSLCLQMGIPYSELLRLSEWERRGWQLYYMVKNKKMQKQREAAERERERKTPKVR